MNRRLKKTSDKTAKFTVRMRKKLVVLFFLVLLAFVGLGYRLYTIVRDNSEDYKRRVLSQQHYESRTLVARRGRITDINGTVLAMSQQVYNVILDTELLLEKEEYLEPTLEALSSKFGVDTASVRAYISENPLSKYYVLKRTLTYDQITGFLDITNPESPNYNKDISGVWFETNYRRNYPNGSLASDVLGFTTSDGNGLYGLEQYYNDELSGTDGREYGYLGDDLNYEYTVIPPTAGNTLVSTIDSNIQSIVERNLKEFNKAHEDEYRKGANGAHNTGCVIMDVNSGEVLAMASYPDFDPNDTQNTEPLIGRYMVDELGNPVRNEALEYTYLTKEQLDQMDHELLMQQFNSLWRNFCISDTYEPGSVGKPFTVATGIEDGSISGNEVYNCGGFLPIGGHQIYCHLQSGHGAIDVKRGIEVSCNVAMMRVAEAIGVDEFVKFQNIFNFGLRTGIDLSGEALTGDLIYNKENMGPTELATCSFGQGYNVTMIEMISAFCSLINGGNYYEPHIVRRIVSDSGATVENIEPRVLKQTISRATSDKVREFCNEAVLGDEATGKTARPAGYAIGGKTGTAETLPRTQKTWYVVSFLGYAPADNPQIAIYTVIDRPNSEDQEYARYATMLTKGILTEVLPYLGIPMTEEMSEAERAELEEIRAHSYAMYNIVPKEEEKEEGAEGDKENNEGAETEKKPENSGEENQSNGSDTANTTTEGTAESSPQQNN